MELAPDGQVLYVAAARACLAAMSGNAQLWQAAAQALSAMPEPLSCMDLAAYRLLTRLVRAHDQNPTGAFKFRRADASSKPLPCPVIASITPASGPSGTTVSITGANLARVQEVAIYAYDESEEVDSSASSQRRPDHRARRHSEGWRMGMCRPAGCARVERLVDEWLTFVEIDPSPSATIGSTPARPSRFLVRRPPRSEEA